MSLATLSLWVAKFFTTASFPVLKENFGLNITFAIHAVVCLVYFWIAKDRVPETKEKSLEEIENKLTGSKTVVIAVT